MAEGPPGSEKTQGEPFGPRLVERRGDFDRDLVELAESAHGGVVEVESFVWPNADVHHGWSGAGCGIEHHGEVKITLARPEPPPHLTELRVPVVLLDGGWAVYGPAVEHEVDCSGRFDDPDYESCQAYAESVGA